MSLRLRRSGERVHGGSRLHCARVTVQVAVELWFTLAASGAAAANLQNCNLCCLCCYVFARKLCGEKCMCVKCFSVSVFDYVRAVSVWSVSLSCMCLLLMCSVFRFLVSIV